MDVRPLVPDAVGGEEASRFLSPFWVGAPARGSGHGRPSGAHGVRRACCLLHCGSAYTSTGLSWKCNETFFTAMFKIQTPELADGRLAVFSPLNILFVHAARVSPDLNPVEKFWAWMRRALRSMDLAYCVAGRPVLTRQQYTARIRAVARSQRAQRAAAACATGLRRVCQEVQRRKGAATRG